MECPICCDEITKATGSTTLSCAHSFHFRCIVNWFDKQLCDDLQQTCPCCRSNGADLDRCEVHELDEEEEEDEEWDEESTEAEEEGEEEEEEDESQQWWEGAIGDFRWERQAAGQWLITSNRQMAYDSLRALFSPLNELEVELTAEEKAAEKIQAIFRGYRDRKVYRGVRNLMSLNPESYLMM